MKKQSARAFLSKSLDCREEGFCQSPTYEQAPYKNVMQRIMFKHVLIKDFDPIHISSREYEERYIKSRTRKSFFPPLAWKPPSTYQT